ncbi:MAG: peptidyl-prolyl cis-trans isomerase [Candidatus Omnitrophota bacterium]|nr:peptidyl-prolyl cis-trans isomerase [Candidatus Omnitrophota bacterium]
MRSRLTIFIAVIFLFLAGCDFLNVFFPAKKTVTQQPVAAKPVVKGTVVAMVNNMPITLEELKEDIAAYNALVPNDKPESRVTTREQKISYLKNDMVRRVLLYDDGLARGLDRSEDVSKEMDKVKQQLVLMALGKKLTDNIDVSSKDIEDYYNTYKEQLREPEKRQVREIVVNTEQEAKDLLIQLLQGADFATLAQQRSKAADAKDGGDMGFISKGDKFSQLDKAAFELEVGKVSSIFKGPEGYYIIKVEAKRGGEQKTLTQLWDDIKRMLIFLKQQQAIEDLVSKLSRDAKIEIYEGKVD